jgi:hypothetical protein
MLVAGVVLVGAILGGVAWTYLYDRAAPLLVRLAAGTSTGLATLALAGFLVASVLGVTPAASVLAAICAVAPAAIFMGRNYRVRLERDLADAIRCHILRPQLHTIAGLLVISIGSFALWRLVDGAMIVRPDGIYTLDRHNFGDLPFHLAAITRFAANQNLPPEHPSFAGLPFTYPFLADFLSSIFVTAGATLRSSVVLPAVLGVFALIILIHQWTRDLTEDSLAAWLAPLLVLVGGGLGWWMFAHDAVNRADDLWTFVWQLPHDYTIRQAEWRWGNVITTLLIPQRGIQLALPLAVVVFRQWWLADREIQLASSPAGRGGLDSTGSPNRRMWAAGCIAGLVPLIHGHSYLVVMAAASVLTLLMGSWGTWARFFIPAVAIGAPQLLWLSWGAAVNATSFVGWAFGWDRGEQNAIVFWILNTGLFIPLIVCAALWHASGRRLVSPRLLRFYLPFVACFLIPNVVRLAPWVWDNNKVLVYWWLASAPLVALLLAHWFRNSGWRRVLASIAFVSLTLAGALDLWRVLSGAAAVQVLSQPAVEFAKLVTDATEPSSTVLHAPIHNHPVVLTGRRSLMGYPGHLWTHGLDYESRQQDIRQIYAGDHDALALIDRYNVDYVVVGADERRFGVVNDPFFSRFAVVGELGDYRLYRVSGQ